MLLTFWSAAHFRKTLPDAPLPACSPRLCPAVHSGQPQQMAPPSLRQTSQGGPSLHVPPGPAVPMQTGEDNPATPPSQVRVSSSAMTLEQNNKKNSPQPCMCICLSICSGRAPIPCQSLQPAAPFQRCMRVRWAAPTGRMPPGTVWHQVLGELPGRDSIKVICSRPGACLTAAVSVEKLPVKDSL